MDRKAQINGWYLVAAILAVLAIQHWWIESRQVETIPYSQFEEMIDAGRLRDVRVGDKYITGTLKEADGQKRFVTVRVRETSSAGLSYPGGAAMVVEQSFPSDLPNSHVRQMLGRKDEVWIAESGTGRIRVIRR